MSNKPITLLKFEIPELDEIPLEEKQQMLNRCWESEPVQAAWKRFWTRPQQFTIIPVILVIIYGLIAKWSPGWLALIAVAISCSIALPISRVYKKRYVSAVRDAVRVHLETTRRA